MSKISKLGSLQKPTSSAWQTTGSTTPLQVCVVVVIDVAVAVVAVVVVVVVVVSVAVSVVEVPVVVVVEVVSMHVLHITLHLS